MDQGQFYIAAATFIIAWSSTVALVVWRLTRIEASLVERIFTGRELTDAKHNLLRQEVDKEIILVKQIVMDLGTALRTKISDVEIYIRDHYVSDKDFDRSMKALGDRFSVLGSTMETHITRVEHKVDEYVKALNKVSARVEQQQT